MFKTKTHEVSWLAAALLSLLLASAGFASVAGNKPAPPKEGGRVQGQSQMWDATTESAEAGARTINVNANGGTNINQVKKVGSSAALKRGTDYTVENEGSSRPKIRLINAASTGDRYQVTATTAGSHGSGTVAWE